MRDAVTMLSGNRIAFEARAGGYFYNPTLTVLLINTIHFVLIFRLVGTHHWFTNDSDSK